MTALLDGGNLLGKLIREAETTTMLWQLGAVAVSLALAWFGARQLRPVLQRMAPTSDDGVDRPAAAAGAARVLTPFLAFVLLMCARGVLNQWMPVRLLDIAVPLASSLVIIRVSVYVLRHALPAGNWVRGSERAIAWTMWTGAVLHITGVLPGIRAALDEIVLPVGQHSISALNVIEGSLSVVVTMLAVLWLGGLAERRLMAIGRLDVSLRVVVSKLIKAVLIVLGVLTALALVGIDITVLSVFGGALGVGLGFGLQKIAANYVSGFAILLDGSVKLGDLVTIDNRYGEVTRLTARYVVVRSQDGTENIIPNETVITSTVVNHSYTDSKVRIDCAVQVDYDTDVRAAMRLIESIVAKHPRVEQEPPPMVILKGFGESGIDLQFFAWIHDPEAGRANLQSDLNLAVLDAFRAQGIGIPFPQRELRILEDPQSTRPASSGRPLT